MKNTLTTGITWCLCRRVPCEEPKESAVLPTGTFASSMQTSAQLKEQTASYYYFESHFDLVL